MGRYTNRRTIVILQKKIEEWQKKLDDLELAEVNGKVE